jgi:zinc transporter ZupT
MKNYFLLMLVMISIAEVIFTVFYIYLSQRVDAVPVMGVLLYFIAAVCLYECYDRDKYKNWKNKLLENLVSGESSA